MGVVALETFAFLGGRVLNLGVFDFVIVAFEAESGTGLLEKRGVGGTVRAVTLGAVPFFDRRMLMLGATHFIIVAFVAQCAAGAQEQCGVS